MKVKRTCESFVAGEGTFNQCLAMHYSKVVANTSAHTVFEAPEVQAYIRELESELKLTAIAKEEDILRFWTDMMTDEDQKGSDRLNASKLLAQHFGMMDKHIDPDDERPPFIIDIAPAKVIPKLKSGKGDSK